ncbi:hypothetical protein GCM10018966_026230 [Streptomyces yanii]
MCRPLLRRWIAPDVARPSGFTHEVIFRRCPSCQQINLVRAADFVCVFCNGILPQEWNVDGPGR